MKDELVWKIGGTSRRLYKMLSEVVHWLEESPNAYLDDQFLRDTNVQLEHLNLAGTDEYFACMKEEDFTNLRPTKPLEPIRLYEDVDYPDSDPPRHTIDFERCAYQIVTYFEELRYRKVSTDGHGIHWSVGLSSWTPRDLYPYEKVLHVGNRIPPSVPFTLEYAFYNDDKPHQVVYAWHGDEGRDGVILKSELQILLRCIRGSIRRRNLCMHNVPVLLLSIHGARARIMIAHFNLKQGRFDIKCSKFEQFDGFEAKEHAGCRDNRVRPQDFEAKRDLFFRWLNPICQGDTYLEDTKDGQEMVMRGPKGRKRLRPRKLPPKSSNSESSENVG